MSRFNPANYTVQTARPIPVILLLDTSGSMEGESINQLNRAIEKMLNTFKKQEKIETTIEVCMITFGATVGFHLTADHGENKYFKSASQIEWQDLQASGMTPMGMALKMAKDMLEDKTIVASNAYRPTVVLVSDGAPNDNWETPLNDFTSNGRSSKCDRMALGIGSGFNADVLNRFKSQEHELFVADDAEKIVDFFKAVTMSVTSRMHSTNPNVVEVKVQQEQSKSIPVNNVSDDDDVFDF